MLEGKMTRRDIAALTPALAALLATEIGLEAQQTAPQKGKKQNVPMRVNIEMIEQALKAMGLEFPEAQRTMMLQNVNRALGNYEALRRIPIPLDTEPAIRFRPALPGKEPKPRASRFVPTKAKLRPFQSVEDLAFSPVTELAALVRAKKVSSTDLTKMYIERLKKYSPKLLCVVTLTEDLAMKQAAQADQEIRSGKYRGPLHGIPFGAKDLFNTKGIRTTWGAEPFRDQVPDYDATCIERMEKAGAVLVAKLSMGALAQGGLWFEGMTKNPWNTERSSSGSSAGSASATSAGLVGFSLGTETLGSIVSPSSTCGVAGLRPTYGRVSRYGAMGLSWTMDKIGPICKSVEDCALVLNAMYGPDGHDTTVIDAPFDWHPATPISALKIAYLKSEFDRQQGDRQKIYAAALEDLKKAGAKLEPLELPQMPTGGLMIILNAEAGAAFDDITRDGRVGQLRGQSPGDWPNSFRSSRMVPAVEYIRAQRARTILQQEMDKLMAQWDVIVTPTGTATLSITNLTGHPQVVVPCGFDGNKLPAGLIFTGKLYEEGTPLRAALAYEQATQWHTMHPVLASS